MDASQTSPRSPRRVGRSYGLPYKRTYESWRFVVQQCTNPAARDYARYGGRGITVCERWLDFRNFLADMGEKPEGRIFGRIDNDGNFEPGNCCWATPEERTRTLKGYRMAEVPGYPLAGKNGLILFHRKVLYDRIGPGWHPCHWCGRLVEWRVSQPTKDVLVVDHLDHDIRNNAPENLVPSCNPCNCRRRRGEMWDPWIPGTPVGRRHQECANGHLLTDDNVYMRPDTGHRQCLTCKKAAHRAQWAAKTPAEREAAGARNRERVPCPVCGELKARGGMAAHTRTPRCAQRARLNRATD
jgi:hypothetical protein